MIPCFSIVIPTKNRPGYLRDSILSVLLQDFDDYELIVSDNFNEASTKEVVTEFESNPHLRYIRTDHEMNMIDHWEFATRHATGKYVILLADRKVLYQHALRKLKKALDNNPRIDVCSYCVKMYNDAEKHMGWSPESIKSKIFSSTELAKAFLERNILMPGTYDYYFTKTLNSCFSNEHAKKVRSISGRYFNNPGVTTPDISSFLINAALVKEMLYIDTPIILTQGEQVSNGRIFSSGQYDAYLSSLGIDDLFAEVPIKAPFNYNLITIDFLVIRRIFQGNLKTMEPCWSNYFVTNYHEYLLKKAANLISGERLNFFKNEWEKGLEQFDESLRQSVFQGIETVEAYLHQPATVGSGGLKNHLRDFINYRFSKLGLVNRIMKYRFPDVLTAAGFDKKTQIKIH
jgi:glycosyltransferase involved in cell wall biosynthesis